MFIPTFANKVPIATTYSNQSKQIVSILFIIKYITNKKVINVEINVRISDNLITIPLRLTQSEKILLIYLSQSQSSAIF